MPSNQSIAFLGIIANWLAGPLALPGAIALLFVSSSVTMAIPFAMGKIIDIIFNVDQEAMRQTLQNVSLALVGVFLVGAACNFGRIYLMHVSSELLRIHRRLSRC